MSMIFRALSLMVLTVSTLWAAPAGRSAPAPPFAAIDTTLLRQVSVDLRHRSLHQVLSWLQRQPAVRSAGVGRDGQTLAIWYRDGLRAAVLPTHERTLRLPLRVFQPDAHVAAPAGAPGARALILEPFATQLGLGPNAGDVEKNSLQGAGFQVDQLYDTQVTVASLASLSKYNVVYMHTHSGVNPGGDAVVATGQLAYNDASLAPLLQNGSVIKVQVSGSDQTYYGITSAYIRNQEGQFPGNSLLFLNGCNLLSAPLFWTVLHAKGVAVMVSWDKEATSKDNYLGAAAFFAEASQGMSVSAALSAEKAAGYGKSDSGGIPATLGYLGDGSLTLAQAANPPPVTPTAAPTTSPTSTVIQRTPSPVVVPTKVAGPPLTLTLKPSVAPGTEQILTINSAPDTVLHIHIQFPNGDTRSTTTATDPSGHARFIFVQHPDKVSFGHVMASVTVDAIKSSATSTLTKNYLIQWARIDVDVQPRVQAIGQAVSIWVHTRARTPVVVGLHFPTGKVKHLQAVTGAAGWTRFVYGVDGRFLKVGKRAVLVRANVRLHGRLYRGQTTFTVK